MCDDLSPGPMLDSALSIDRRAQGLPDAPVLFSSVSSNVSAEVADDVEVPFESVHRHVAQAPRVCYSLGTLASY